MLGVSVDSQPCLKAWAESLGEIAYPLLSDFWPHGIAALSYGVLRPEGHSERAVFVLDAAGVIRYIDIHDIDKAPDIEVIFAELERLQQDHTGLPNRPPATAAKPADEATPQQVATGRTITMYCTQWCSDCRRAREWFAARGLEYTEVDVESDAAAAAKVRQWAGGNLTTPCIEIDGSVVVDFDEDALAAALQQGSRNGSAIVES